MYNMHVFRGKTKKWDPDQLGTTCEFNDSLAALCHLTSWTQTCVVDQITCMSKFYDDISQMAKLRTLNPVLTLGITWAKFSQGSITVRLVLTVLTMLFAKHRMFERTTRINSYCFRPG